MKSIIYVLALTFSSLVVLSFSSPINNDVEPINNMELEYNEVFKKDLLYTVSSESLEKRFETQFHSMIADVTKIDVHYNELNNYYYTVHGVSPEGNKIIEYFKTTASQVANSEYNYIEMNEKTMNAINNLRATKCREATSFPFPIPGAFCHQTYSGPICGIVINGYCWYY